MKEFTNTPDAQSKKTQEEEPVSSSFHFSFGTAIICIITLAFLACGIFVLAEGSKMWSVRKEIFFTIDHPDMVKPVQEIYEQSHKKVDEDLKHVLMGK